MTDTLNITVEVDDDPDTDDTYRVSDTGDMYDGPDLGLPASDAADSAQERIDAYREAGHRVTIVAARAVQGWVR